MRHLGYILGLLMVLFLATGALAQEAGKAPAEGEPKAEKAEDSGQPTADSGEDEKAEKPAPPEGEAPPKKSDRRPYTATEFEMENMSDIEIDAYGKISKIREDSIGKMKELIDKNPNYPNLWLVLQRS